LDELHFNSTLCNVSECRLIAVFLRVLVEREKQEREVMQRKRLVVFQRVDDKRDDGDMFVDLTVYDVPAGLLREFGEKVVHSSYPSGVNEAIKDLLRKAIIEHESKRTEARLLAT
jgi:hypothetical protein